MSLVEYSYFFQQSIFQGDPSKNIIKVYKIQIKQHN